ncbi:hypothetical protein [Kitasatospora sp. NPDC096204]|uniref:hypothetical protein n=1 Tax=Kitasatospora sp. NPDC096204 TaxID=3364094 RepID=UPI00381A3C7F
MIDRVAAGERTGIADDGRLTAAVSPADRERRVLADLVRDGTLGPENAATARGLADWAQPGGGTGRGTGLGSASEALLARREEGR